VSVGCETRRGDGGVDKVVVLLVGNGNLHSIQKVGNVSMSCRRMCVADSAKVGNSKLERGLDWGSWCRSGQTGLVRSQVSTTISHAV
jgi:hypothetical protein